MRREIRLGHYFDHEIVPRRNVQRFAFHAYQRHAVDSQTSNHWIVRNHLKRDLGQIVAPTFANRKPSTSAIILLAANSVGDRQYVRIVVEGEFTASEIQSWREEDDRESAARFHERRGIPMQSCPSNRGRSVTARYSAAASEP